MAVSKNRRSATGYTDHGVRLTDPTDAKPYYRITWVEGGKRRETTASYQGDALLKMASIEKRLSVTHGERSLQTVAEMVHAYINPKKGDYSRKTWNKKHTRNIRNLLNQRLVEELGKKRCADLTLDDLKQSLSKVTTASLAEHYGSALGTLISWGYREDWILKDPSKWTKELNMLRDRIKSEKRKKNAVVAGESSKFVSKKDIPSASDVDKLAKATVDVTGIWWYELLVNLAAYSGARDGEVFDLDVDDVDPIGRIMNIETQRLDDGGNLSQELPKWDTVRTTTFVERTPMGYPLAAQLQRRVNELKGLDIRGKKIEEVEIPVLQNGQQRLLLFPNTQGGWNSNSNFAKRVRLPAQKMAGWKKAKDGKYLWNFHSLRHVFCSHMISDLGCAPIDVSIAAGHKNLSTTLEMYVGNSEGAIDRLRASSAFSKVAKSKPVGRKAK
jgi:integrase